MIDRVPSGFHPFVLPFLIGMIFVFAYCIYGIIKILIQLSSEDRKKFFISLITPKTMVKNIYDIFTDCLLHVKLWKRNKLLGYMHSSIAFGWFMIILLGHLEVIFFVPKRINLFYYPIFFNYFVAEGDQTLKGSLLFFLMDFFLLVILSGIILAIVKRIRSRFFGMRRTTRQSFVNQVGMYALWAIFPLRLLAECFTAHISGGSFLTIPGNWLFRHILGNDLYFLPTWWAYSIALCVFMVILPFSRYMHIPAEMMLIPMRNAGLRVTSARRGFARVQVFSCPNCGVCIDACPMSVDKKNLKDCTVYLTRQIRRGNKKRIDEISDKCLLCGKCESLCQVGVEGPKLRMMHRGERTYNITPDYSNINLSELVVQSSYNKVAYFSGCMTKLIPSIGKSIESIFNKAKIEYIWLDKDSGLCCGRPMLTAGRFAEAAEIVKKNKELIMSSGVETIVVSCPICYKMFLEEYNMKGINVLYYTKYFTMLINSGYLKIDKSDLCYVYHDPCDLGRGCGIYEEPRKLIARVARISEAPKNREESVCCGGSLGSLSLTYSDRKNITNASLKNLYESKADAIATACPLCKSTFANYSDRPVRDIAEIIDKQSVSNK